MAENEQQFEQVEPKKFTLTILGKEREIKFGNLALAKAERKFGSLQKFAEKLQAEMQEKPLEHLPWLLSICLKDKTDIGDSEDDILTALDDSNLSFVEAFSVIGEAISSTMSYLNSDGKKKVKKTK